MPGFRSNAFVKPLIVPRLANQHDFHLRKWEAKHGELPPIDLAALAPGHTLRDFYDHLDIQLNAARRYAAANGLPLLMTAETRGSAGWRCSVHPNDVRPSFEVEEIAYAIAEMAAEEYEDLTQYVDQGYHRKGGTCVSLSYQFRHIRCVNKDGEFAAE